MSWLGLPGNFLLPRLNFLLNLPMLHQLSLKKSPRDPRLLGYAAQCELVEVGAFILPIAEVFRLYPPLLH